MKNSELQEILKTMPDDLEIAIGSMFHSVESVTKQYCTINGIGATYIQITDETD